MKYWFDKNSKGTLSLFVLNEWELTEYENVKVTGIEHPLSTDILKNSVDGGITVQLNFEKVKRGNKDY